MTKKVAKLIAMEVLIIMCIGLFVGCSDYGYQFHFDVVAGNGEITLDNENLLKKVEICSEGPWCELECSDTSQFIMLFGGKKGQQLKLIAFPNEGYQVKEWLFNGQIVENNKSNSCTVKVTSAQNYSGIITVEFEPI